MAPLRRQETSPDQRLGKRSRTKNRVKTMYSKTKRKKKGKGKKKEVGMNQD